MNISRFTGYWADNSKYLYAHGIKLLFEGILFPARRDNLKKRATILGCLRVELNKRSEVKRDPQAREAGDVII
ncbi:hypothetical protein NO1_0358 [Candidatus Termititenax aidoneus]|uniref:Uncharacterized protein n=1 Tax=Termititenax aidoneus TaxID=2218524 RepID=A0A388T8F6_TERA1|nr:hypothetical protein NO1_0358 [Candidatus Termititenax aidoneus]